MSHEKDITRTPGRRVLVLLNWSRPQITRGTMEYARQAGWWIESPFVVWWGTPPEAVIPSPDNPVDGMLTLLFNMPASLAELMRRAKVPTVSLSPVHLPRVLTVLPDDDAIGRLGAAALVERGFRHVAFAAAMERLLAKERYRGFCRAARQGGAVPIVLEMHSHSADNLADLGRRLIQLPKPLGIMGFGDSDAAYVMRACRLVGLAVPEQVAVIGAGNDEMSCELAPVPISSVRLDDYRHGYESAKVLDDLMSGRAAPKGPLLIEPLGVVHRQSTDILAVPDVTVAKALRYIWQNITNSRLSVTEVAAFAGISVSSLNNAFKQHLGTPIGWQIRHKRLTAAMDLLGNSRRKVKEIATLCGYRDEEHLRSTLRGRTGLSPRAWRKQNPGGDGG
ncbi:MAG: substrate-binding domain-containing protein [Planctomycetaceae bacterium]|nr:substrate-binding domain-containing protein [Planctomycetaceae bacterium]